MVISSINYVPDTVSEEFSAFNVDKTVEEDKDFVYVKNNTNGTRLTMISE